MSSSPVANANPTALAGSVDATRWAYVGLLLACGIGASMQVGKVPPALGLIQRDLRLGLVAGAWVISMFSIVGATLGCLAGSMVDRIGPHRAATVGLFGVAAASLAGSLVVLPWVLLVSRAFEGMAFVMVVVAIPSLLVASASETDRRGGSSLSSVMPASPQGCASNATGSRQEPSNHIAGETRVRQAQICRYRRTTGRSSA
jgi:MFS family permease